MKKKRSPRLYLEDILSAIAHVEEYTVKGREEFLRNGLVQDGVIRQISVIGEASSKLPPNLRKRYPAVPWKKIIGMRNVVIHDYSEIDIFTVWDTADRDLPVLKKTVQAMVEELAG